MENQRKMEIKKMKYKVEVEAIQWTGDLEELKTFVDGKAKIKRYSNGVFNKKTDGLQLNHVDLFLGCYVLKYNIPPNIFNSTETIDIVDEESFNEKWKEA